MSGSVHPNLKFRRFLPTPRSKIPRFDIISQLLPQNKQNKVSGSPNLNFRISKWPPHLLNDITLSHPHQKYQDSSSLQPQLSQGLYPPSAASYQRLARSTLRAASYQHIKMPAFLAAALTKTTERLRLPQRQRGRRLHLIRAAFYPRTSTISAFLGSTSSPRYRRTQQIERLRPTTSTIAASYQHFKRPRSAHPPINTQLLLAAKRAALPLNVNFRRFPALTKQSERLRHPSNLLNSTSSFLTAAVGRVWFKVWFGALRDGLLYHIKRMYTYGSVARTINITNNETCKTSDLSEENC